jgi:hypothetical protein
MTKRLNFVTLINIELLDCYGRFELIYRQGILRLN